MNKADRKELEKASELITQAEEIIAIIVESEQEKYDNMPEGIQMSERGSQFEDNISSLETIKDELESARESLDEIINS